MNQAHFHLIVNHLPIIIPVIGLLVLIGGFITRNDVVKRTAFFIFIIGALATIPAFATGEGAEETIEHLQGISKQTIHAHEEVAETFAVLSYILGGIALLALFLNWKKISFANIVAGILILFSVVVLYFAKETGTTGGEIRHTEIRSNNTISNSLNGEKSKAGKKDDDD